MNKPIKYYYHKISTDYVKRVQHNKLLRTWYGGVVDTQYKHISNGEIEFSGKGEAMKWLREKSDQN